MVVYIVMMGTQYEGDEVDSVYRSKHEANDRMKAGNKEAAGKGYGYYIVLRILE